MRRLSAIVTTAAIVAWITPVWGVQTSAPSTPERPAHFVLADASPSIDALITRLLDAVAKNDADALQRLRVTENEYRTFLLPGGGDPGQPVPAYDEESSKYAWGIVNANSAYNTAGILREYGGRTFTVKAVTYLKGRKEYAWYTAYKTVNLKLEDENGKERELLLGSIADVEGQFKFISLLGKR